MARDVPAPVACHNDLLAENFILGDDGRMWVIDWEYGGVNDPYYDLGVLCAENPLTEDEERAVITRYCGAHGRAPPRTHDAVQDRLGPVVEPMGDGAGAILRTSSSTTTAMGWTEWRVSRPTPHTLTSAPGSIPCELHADLLRADVRGAAGPPKISVMRAPTRCVLSGPRAESVMRRPQAECRDVSPIFICRSSVRLPWVGRTT